MLNAPVPPVPTDVPPGSIAWLRASVARFSNGTDHARRRALAVSLLASLDPEVLRDKAFAAAVEALGDRGDVMALVARRVPVGVLAGELGLSAADVLLVAPAYHPHVSPSPEAEAALARLLGGDVSEAAAARIGVVIQACDATAGLIGNAVPLVLKGTTPAEAMARAEQPVVRTRRRIAGEDVVVDLTGRPFGAGAHECPGVRHAMALATGVLTALRGFRRTEGEVEYEPSPNLRVPARLAVTRDHSVGGFC